MANPLFDEMIKRALVADPKMAQAVDPATAAPASAEHKGLDKAALLTYLAGLGADVGTTAYGAATGKTQEANPLMKGLGPKAAAPLVAGTSLLSALLVKKLLGKSHPVLADSVLMGMGGAHGVAALGNARELGKTPAAASAPASSAGCPPGMVPAPGGGCYNPDSLSIKP